jgi:hypothetical protein
MAISGQEIIQVGIEDQATGSDNLYVAFNKTQNNFTTLFNSSSPYNTFASGDGVNVVSNSTSGIVTITNTGVLNLSAGTGITLSGSNGNVTISSAGGGNGAGVTSIGLSSNTLVVNNSPIVSSGNINVELPIIPITGTFVPGDYIAASLSVDRYGRIVNIANTVSVGTVTSVALAANGSGIGISGGPITSNGTIQITNTGVTRINAGTGINISGSTGNITIASSIVSTGTVTRVDITSTTLNVINSPITGSGTIRIDIPNNISLAGNLSVNNSTQLSNTAINGALYLNWLAANGSPNIGTAIMPGNTGVYDIGSSSAKFRDSWFTGNVNATKFVGNVTGTVDGIIGTNTPANGTFTNVSIGTALLVTGNISATGNLVAGNIKSNTSANIIGNLVAGNITTAGNITVTAGNVNFVNILATGDATLVGNVLGNVINGNLVVANTFVVQSVSANVSAAGSTITDATPLTSYLNIVNTVPASTGVKLPNAVIGTSVKVINNSANTLNVFPSANATINSLSANLALSVAANARIEFTASGNYQWFTFP